MDDSNTAPNTRRHGGKPFSKGDPRINRKGRPKSFDALRALALQIAHEAKLKDGEPITIEGHVVTVVEDILRSWATSRNPLLQKSFIEVAFGKVPDEVKLGNSDNKPLALEIRGVDYRAAITNLAPRSMGDSPAPGEDEDAFNGS